MYSLGSVFVLTLLIGYFKRKAFYDEILFQLEKLDKKFLITETLETPGFYEGELLCNVLYEVDKSMIEHIKKYETATQEFKEYIEMWIHEIKIPISSLTLMAHNKNMDYPFSEQIKRLENYTEQVLYFVRSENAEQDYLIKENRLSKIINNIAMKNKDDLWEKNIDFIVENTNQSIQTDAKWLEFILNQIINNSIKYADEKKEKKYIRISATEQADGVTLSIEDNGIGIEPSDITRVFEKTFTGENGRKINSSTGMGLYIAGKLCKKLGHKINIASKKGEYTRVNIVFGKDEYYEIVK